VKNGALLDPDLPEVVVTGQLPDVSAIDEGPKLLQKTDLVRELRLDASTDAGIRVAITVQPVFDFPCDLDPMSVRVVPARMLDIAPTLC
jgi:hypothetical protein